MTCTNWKKLAIFEVAEVITGTTPITSDKNNYGADIPFVSPGDLGNQKYIVSAEKYLSLKGANKARIVPYGSTLFTCIGSTIGKVGIAGKPLTTNQQINAAIPKHISAEFLYYSLCYISEKVKRIAGIQAVPIINKSEFESQILHIPTCYNIQNQIAAILSTWDQAIEKTERLIVAKEKRYTHLVRCLIANEGHRRGHIRDLTAEISKRNNGTAIDRVLSVTNRNGFVLPEDQFERRVASSDLSNYKVVTRGQYAYNPSRINVGSIARLDGWDTGILSPMYVVFEIDEQQVNSDFFLHWLSSHEAKERIRKSAQGSVRETVSFTDLGAISFPVPPLEQQVSSAETLNIARQEIDILKKQAEAYSKQKRGLMQKLLTGQWKVKISKGILL